MLRRAVCLILATLLAPVSSTCLADPKDQPDMACLERVVRSLPGPVRPASIKPWPIKARKLGAKRLVFRRGDVLLVIDHAVFREKADVFLLKNNATLYQSLIRGFRKQLENANEAVINDDTMTREERSFLRYQLAAVLEEGKFEIRTRTKPLAKVNGSATNTIIRLDWSYTCGDLCSGTGRTFIAQDCQELVSVTDIQS